ncbi:uncharacterized protein CBL_04025 [Carabus blaptoides fortunei]
MSEEGCFILQPGVDIRPKITISESQILLELLYGVKCKTIVELNAYDDKNYKVTLDENCENVFIPKINEHGYVLKIMNKLDSQKLAFVDAQNKMMLYLGNNNIKCPKPVLNKRGEYYSLEKLEGSGDHVVRLLEFLPGKIFYEVPPTPDLLYDVGRYVANLNKVLKNFYHTAYKSHKSLWMFEAVPDIKKFLYVVKNKEDKQMIEAIIDEFEIRVLRNMGILEKGMLHGDFNEQNIVVRETEDGSWKIDSILDFGDSQYSCLLFELAIAITYMILQCKEIYMAGHVLAGYSFIQPVPEHEYKLLKVCVAARLCQSLVLGAYSSLQDPNNKYILTTQTTGWTMLRKLWKEPEEILYEEWKKVEDEYK